MHLANTKIGVIGLGYVGLPLAVAFARRYPVRREAMARAFQTGVYTMQEIADYFGVHYSTVSRAVRRLETGQDSQTGLPAEPRDA